MAHDIGLDYPDSLEALARAASIVSALDTVHDEVVELAYNKDNEVYRIARALPPGPISFDRTMYVAMESARAALDQVSGIVCNHVPTTMIVLQTLLRAALVGAGRSVFALLPTDPDVRLANARVLIAQESGGFTKALKDSADFHQFDLLRPENDYVDRAQRQKKEILQGDRPPGDGAVMRGAANELATALDTISEHPDQNRQQIAEHVTWLWNTLSGLAHTHAWPHLLPGTGQDRRSPGDFARDFFIVAATAHVAAFALKDRLQPGSAGTTAPAALR